LGTTVSVRKQAKASDRRAKALKIVVTNAILSGFWIIYFYAIVSKFVSSRINKAAKVDFH